MVDKRVQFVLFHDNYPNCTPQARRISVLQGIALDTSWTPDNQPLSMQQPYFVCTIQDNVGRGSPFAYWVEYWRKSGAGTTA